jgi:hypothetical protein
VRKDDPTKVTERQQNNKYLDSPHTSYLYAKQDQLHDNGRIATITASPPQQPPQQHYLRFVPPFSGFTTHFIINKSALDIPSSSVRIA